MKKSLLFGLTLLFLFCTDSYSQDRTVTGKVSDEQGGPLPGVNVVLKGTTNGTVTDIDGNYNVSAGTNSDGILVFSFIGFETQEIVLGSRSVIDVTMLTDVQQLSEVVVVGYGTQEKKDISSSISIISAEDAKDNPIPSVEGIIQGRAAGINISQSSGIPGQAMSVKIRGTTSISASNEPLYVVDGVPMVSEDNSTLFTGGYNSNSMADLNPGDIATISVLKDAAATAIYGSRGANGVVLITTKRGASGKPSINFNYYTGVQEPTRVIEMLNSSEFIEMLDEAASNDGFVEGYWSGNGPGFNFIGDPNDPDLRNTDWLDEIYQSGSINNYDLNASGGNETINYYVGGSYLENEGYFKGSSFDRISGRVNLDIMANEKLKFGTNVAISRTQQNRPIGDNSLYGGPINSLAGDPTMPVFEDDGSYADPFVYWSWWAFENPRAATDIYQRESFTNRALATVFAELEILPNLTFKSSWTIDYKTLKDRSYIPSNAAQSFRNGIEGQGFFATYEDYTYNVENFLTYAKQIGDHNLRISAIYSLQESNSEFSSITGQTYALDALPNLELASEITEGSQDGTSWGIRSITGRVNYGYKDKYLLNLTARYDGSSRFGQDNQNGVFPAASVAWRIINEPFLEGNSIFSDLKLRASYGITGNQEGINNFASRALWTTGAAYNNQGGAVPNRLGNGNLQWERTASVDIGLDVSLLEDRINLTADYYNKQTTDLLLNAPVTSLSGFSTATQNLGEMENKGFELGINTVNLDGALKWETSFNIAFNRNKIKKLVNDSTNIGTTHVLIEGEVLGTYFMPIWDGVDPQTGNSVYQDLNNDGVINADDSQVLGSIQPDYFGGLTNRFSYKGIDLSFFFHFMIGHEIYNRSRHAYENGGFSQNFGGFFQPYGNITRESYEERWQQPGDVTRVPRLSMGWSPDGNGGFNRLDPQWVEQSSQFVEDGSFIRLKNVTLGYTIPSSVLEKTKILKSARIYAQAQNLFIITDYLGQDPEVSSNGESVTAPGEDFGALGPPRTFIFGINLGL